MNRFFLVTKRGGGRRTSLLFILSLFVVFGDLPLAFGRGRGSSKY